ncbi:peptide/nickel transport system permease protein [Virgibacillus subterraneus]|uniref:Peptide/nickel transport system permease protein n=1 Tax=Virgibacillus subterraneus TaxID=621109 RepID=A0A1H9KZT2_9BACI|nr:ABC transporter permease subunit [Virgibacillus subterraneus]SER04568.1 peptide/nickel transport system permease protein [Virgibacillus subterraneus]
MIKLAKLLLFYTLGVFGIICISVFPQFFQTSGLSNPLNYFKDLSTFLVKFVQPESWVYQVPNSPGQFPLIGTLWEPFIYSMQILIGALLLGFVLAFSFALITNFLPKRVLHIVKRLLDFLESIPDIVIAAVLQMIVIYVKQTYEIELFQVATYLDDKAYAGPIVTLAILPMVSLFKILLLMIEEEFTKDYVIFLKSKGIKKFSVLVRHILKNILPTTFHHTKIILWATLSSQFIIERIFNVHGFSFFIIESFTPMTIAVSLILLFTPFFLIFRLVDLWTGQDIHLSGDETPVNRKSMLSFFSINQLFRRLRKFNWSRFKPWKQLFAPFLLFFRHMKNWKFAVGSLFFIVLISYSAIYSITTDNHIDKTRIVYENDGVTIQSTPPHPPPDPFLLGSDKLGFSISDMLVIGAKYTLIFALIIAFLRVIIGMIGGVMFAFTLGPKRQNWIEKTVDSIHFLPLSLIAYLLLRPILMEQFNGFAYSFTERIIYEIIILTILVVPLTSVLSGNEMKRVLNAEFIKSARVLGGGRFHIFWRHVLPHIGPRMTILFGQQFIQVLVIFMHLGIFNFFFGGTNISFGAVKDPPRSITYEWSGMLGSTANALSSGKYWIIAWVLIAFILSIFAMQFIIQGVKEIQQTKVGVIYNLRKIKKKRSNRLPENNPDYEINSNSFKIIKYNIKNNGTP